MPFGICRAEILRYGVALFLAVSVVAAPVVGTAQEPGKARLGYNPAWGAIALNIAVSHGYLKKAGVDVTERRFDNPADIVQAMASGDLDVGVSPAGILFTAVQRGVKVKAVGVAQGTQNPPIAYMVRADSGINSVADLRGKTAGIGGYGGNVDLFLRYWLAKSNLDPKTDVKIVFVPFQLTLPALANRQIDIGAIDSVAGLVAQKRYPGQLKPLFTYVDVTEDAFKSENENSLLLLFTDAFMQRDRDTAIKFLEGYLTAIKVVHTDPKTALDDWADATKVEEIRALKKPGTLPADGKVYLDALKFEGTQAYRFGYLNHPIDTAASVDNSLIEEAAARLK